MSGDAVLNIDWGKIKEYQKDKYESVGFNADLADEVLAVIEAMPERWNQGSWAEADNCPPEGDILETGWSCGTGMCFAGWAVELGHGLDWYKDSTGYVFAAPAGEGELLRNKHDGALYYEGPNIKQVAQELLGVTETEAGLLFSGWNNLNDLKQKVMKLKKKYGVKNNKEEA